MLATEKKYCTLAYFAATKFSVILAHQHCMVVNAT